VGDGANVRRAAEVSSTAAVGGRVNEVIFRMKKTGSPTDNIVLRVFGAGANPEAGALLIASTSVSADTLTTSYASTTFMIDNWLIATSTQYYFVIARSGAQDGSHYYNIDAATNVTANTKRWLYDGATWTNDAVDFSFSYGFGAPVGQAVEASGVETHGTIDAVLGISNATTSAGGTASIVTQGNLSGFSGLNIGFPYYLASTTGNMATSSGNIVKKMGIATASTTLIVQVQPY